MSIGYVNALIDIWNNNDCAALIDWRIPFKIIIDLLQEADIHTCYIEKELFSKVEESISIDYSIDYIIYEKQNSSAEMLPKYIFDKYKVNYSKDEAVIIYSSGTTGKSKGIILSHFAITSNADAIINYMNLCCCDCMYITKALSHSSTLTGELLVSLRSKIQVIIAPTVVPPRYVLNRIKEFSVTLLCLNPTLLRFFLDEYQKKKYSLKSLKTIYCSGAILSNKLYEEAHSIFKDINIFNVYGLSEAGPRVTAQTEKCRLGNSVGKAIKGVTIAIVDENGVPVTNGRCGIIHVNTPSRYSGYVRGVEKHQSLYRSWLNTGDIGYIDENGELYVIDRIDDVININAHKIYPRDIEKVICECDMISDCVIYDSVDNRNEQVIVCLYVPKKKESIQQNILISHCQKYMSSYEIPRKWICVEAIPKNINGKISRKNLKTMYKLGD